MALAPSLSVIIPAFNNATTIEELLDRLRHELDIHGWRYEVVVIDDGSTDSTWAIIDEISARDPRVIGVRFSRNFGQQAGIAAGLEAASGEVLVLMDADLEDDPRDLHLLTGPILEGQADMVVSIAQAGVGKQKRLLSKAFHRLFGMLAAADVPPNIGTYRAFTAAVADALLAYQERGIVFGPVMQQIGFRVAYRTVDHGVDSRGGSSYTLRKRWRLASDALLSYSDIPYRAVIWAGSLLAFGSVLFLMILVIQYVVFDVRFVNGFGVLAAMLAFFTGVMMLSLSALFAYLIRVFREVLHRPRFHVMDRRGRGLDERESP